MQSHSRTKSLESSEVVQSYSELSGVVRSWNHSRSKSAESVEVVSSHPEFSRVDQSCPESYAVVGVIWSALCSEVSRVVQSCPESAGVYLRRGKTPLFEMPSADSKRLRLWTTPHDLGRLGLRSASIAGRASGSNFTGVGIVLTIAGVRSEVIFSPYSNNEANDRSVLYTFYIVACFTLMLLTKNPCKIIARQGNAAKAHLSPLLHLRTAFPRVSRL